MRLTAKFLVEALLSEGKKKFLTDKYPQMTPEDMEIIEKADPTRNSAYAEWLIEQWKVKSNINLPEDTRNIKPLLTKFDKIKEKEEFKRTESSDIRKYDSASLKETIDKFLELIPRETPYPEGLGDSTILLYEDGKYFLWKVTDPKDLVILSKNKGGRESGWCTREIGMAKHYLSTGADYVGFKDGDPLFQYDPGTGQFMDKFNKTMQSAKIMNEEAYNLIMKASETEPDLKKVTETYGVADLNEADSLGYLKDVLSVNPEYAKDNPKFQEIENGFIAKRLEIFDMEELELLLKRWPRTAQVLSKMDITKNPALKKLSQKIEGKTYEELRTMRPPTSTAEGDFIIKVPFLFKHIFGPYEKETGLKERVDRLKKLVKGNDLQEVVSEAMECQATIDRFSVCSGSSSGIQTSWGVLEEKKAELKKHISSLIKSSITIEKAKGMVLNIDPNQNLNEMIYSYNRYINNLRSLLGDGLNATEIVINSYKPVITKKLSEMKKIREIEEVLGYKDSREWRNKPRWITSLGEDRKQEIRDNRGVTTGPSGRTRYAPSVEVKRWLDNPTEDRISERGEKFLSETNSIDTSDKLNYYMKTKLWNPEFIEHLSTRDKFSYLSALGREIPEEMEKQMTHDYVNYYLQDERQGGPMSLYLERKYKNKPIPNVERSLLTSLSGHTGYNPGLANLSNYKKTVNYLKKHRKEDGWPELKEHLLHKILPILQNNPNEELADGIMNGVFLYVAATKKRIKELEPFIWNKEAWGLKYVSILVPDALDTFRRLMDEKEAKEEAEGKTSSISPIAFFNQILQEIS